MEFLFSVGDTVAPKEHVPYGVTNRENGWVGVVTGVNGRGIQVRGRGTYDINDCTFLVDAKYFELVNPEKVEPPETDPFAGLFNERGKQT